MDSPSISDHVLLRKIGSGSYGDVWLARNVFGAYRAVKIIGTSTEEQERHLEREFEGIKKFEPISRSHEGFVDILHAGHDQTRRFFYYVMEIGDDAAAGQTIIPDTYRPKTLSSEIKIHGRLPVAECVRYGLLLSDALRELHAQGLIHRDIKPCNIIFVNGTPKLADIGLVTQIDEANSYVGTEGFIPPEGPTSVQADVYALGKVLYEMASGRDRKEFPALPHELNQFPDAAGFLELNEVIVRACHTDRARRYQSAADLGEELLILQHGTSLKRLRGLEKRWLRFKRVAAIMATFLAIAGLIGWPLIQQKKMSDEARSRQTGKLLADASHLTENGDLVRALPLLAQAIEIDQRNDWRIPTHWLRVSSLIDQLPELSAFAVRSNGVMSIDWSPDGQRAVLVEVNGQTLILDPLSGQCSDAFGPSQTRMARFSFDGQWIATAHLDHMVRVYRADTRELVQDIDASSRVESATFSHDGHRLIAACHDGHARVFDVNTGALVHDFLAHTNILFFAAFSPDDRLVVTAGTDNTARLWDTATWQAHGDPLLHPSWVFAADFSPDGKTLVTACFDRVARIWDLERGRLIPPGLKHGGGVHGCRFSPDGAWIITASYDSTVRLWNAATQEPVQPVAVLPGSAQALDVAIAPDGRRIAMGCDDGTVRVWDLAATGAFPKRTFDTYTPSGDRYFTAPDDKTLRLIDQTAAELAELRFTTAVRRVSVSDDGTFVATLTGDLTPGSRSVSVWNVSHPSVPVFSMIGAVDQIVLSGNGATLATISGTQIVAYAVASGHQLFQTSAKSPNDIQVVFDPQGTLAAVIKKKTIEVRLTSTGDLQFPEMKFPGTVQHLVFSRSGRSFVTGCNDSLFSRFPAQIFESATGVPLGPPFTHRDGILAVRFSPDDRRILTCSEDFKAMLWDATTGQQLFVLEHNDQVQDAEYSQDGRWIVTASTDGTARIWDAETGEPITPPWPHVTKLNQARFVMDDRFVLATDANGNGWLHTLDAAPWSLVDLKLYAHLVAGDPTRAVAAAGGRPASELLALCKSPRFPALLHPDRSAIIAWHRERERLLAKAGETRAAEFHEGRIRALQSAGAD